MGKGADTPDIPSQTTTVQQSLPAYAEPFYRELLGRAVYETSTPYQAFPGQRLADFNPAEMQAMQGIQGLQAPGQIGQATQMAMQAGQAAGTPYGSGYTAGQFTPGYQAGQANFSGIGALGQMVSGGAGQGGRFSPPPPSMFERGELPASQAAQIPGTEGASRIAGLDMSALAGTGVAGPGGVPSGYDPMVDARAALASGQIGQEEFNQYEQRANQRRQQMQAAGSADPYSFVPQGGAPAGPQGGAGPYQSQYNPNANLGPNFQPGTLADQSAIQSYMSPYQQMVTDIEKREASRQSDIMGRDIGLGAAGQGSLGGYREAIMQAERQRNLGQQLGDIQARGSAAAFNQAQQAFEADRARQLQASQLGLQRGTAQEGFQQAAEQFRQGAFGMGADVASRLGQLQIQGYQAGEQARQRAAELGLTAQQQQEAARQAQEQFNQSAYGLNLDAQGRQLGAAQLLGQLGSVQQGLDLDRLRSQQAAGQIQRELQQRGLDIGYQDFLRQQAFPREQLGLFSSLLQGLPIAPGSTTATFGQTPTAEQQILGSGIAGVGLYNALRGAQ